MREGNREEERGKERGGEGEGVSIGTPIIPNHFILCNDTLQDLHFGQVHVHCTLYIIINIHSTHTRLVYNDECIMMMSLLCHGDVVMM